MRVWTIHLYVITPVVMNVSSSPPLNYSALDKYMAVTSLCSTTAKCLFSCVPVQAPLWLRACYSFSTSMALVKHGRLQIGLRNLLGFSFPLSFLLASITYRMPAYNPTNCDRSQVYCNEHGLLCCFALQGLISKFNSMAYFVPWNVPWHIPKNITQQGFSNNVK